MKKSAKVYLGLLASLVIGCSEQKPEAINDLVIHTDTNTQDTVEVYQEHGAGFFFPYYILYNHLYYNSGGGMYRSFSSGEIGSHGYGRASFSSGFSKGAATRGGFGHSVSSGSRGATS